MLQSEHGLLPSAPATAGVCWWSPAIPTFSGRHHGQCDLSPAGRGSHAADQQELCLYDAVISGSGQRVHLSQEQFGYDHGFLTAWFLTMTYLAVFWANATSLPLFARYFLGNIFRFGRLYTLFGYEVYLGEAYCESGFLAFSNHFVRSYGK